MNKTEMSLYFKDEAAGYIFLLTKIIGKSQVDLLGITLEHFSNKEVADT